MEPIYLGVIVVAIVVLLVVIINKNRNNPSMSNSTEQDIIDAINNGNKVEAIKHYRFVHNVGLKDAKKAIEAMQQKT